MKRLFEYISLIILGFMMLITNSCAEDEFALSTERAIEFSSSYVGKPASRMAGDIYNENVRNNSFYVYGHYYDVYDSTETKMSEQNMIFNKTIVSHNGSWTYSPIKYYDTNKKYSFVGVMPAITNNDNRGIQSKDITYTEDGRIKITNIPLTQQIIKQDETPYGIDYLVSASVDNHTAGDGTVLLNFKHILSRFSIYVYTGADTTTTAKVTLTQMSIYLPNGTASYEELYHTLPTPNVVNAIDTIKKGDKWTWKGFENSTDKNNIENNNNYTQYNLFTAKTTSKDVPYFDGIPNTSDIPGGLMPVEFFMAPIQYNKLAKKEDLQLYMKLRFLVDYKDGIKQEIVRDTPILIHDLHSFTQNYRTNLFVKLLAENDVIAFNVTVDEFENTTNHWVDQYGYSFDLVEYEQTKSEGKYKNEITGILDNFGNTLEGDSKTELKYYLTGLYKDEDNSREHNFANDNSLDFDAGWDNNINGMYGGQHIKKNRYGKFTINLGDATIEKGWYTMVIRNSMNDIREYRIYLNPAVTPYFMAFTVAVGNNDKYTIPFVTYESASTYFDKQITNKLPSFLEYAGVSVQYVNFFRTNTTTLDTWCKYVLGNLGFSGADTKDVCFTYPSDLIIDWGDDTVFEMVRAGTYVIDDNIPTHVYLDSGEYTITIYTNQYDYTKSQIPQISWSVTHIASSNVLPESLGNIYDSKLISIDTPILHMENNWAIHELTFSADPIAAGHDLYLYAFVNDFTSATLSEPYYGSILSSMFNTCSSLKNICGEVFRYNGNYWSLDLTFQFCHALESIPSDLFTGCDIIESMYYTFDNAALKSIPSGLFDGFTHDVWFKCTFLDCIGLSNSNVPDNLFTNCGSGSIYDGTFNGTSVTKYNS